MEAIHRNGDKNLRKYQADPCPNCAGAKFKIVGGKLVHRDCNDCIAQSLIKCESNPLGILSLESAKQQCLCLANNHKKENMTYVEPSEKFLEVQEESLKKQIKDEKDRQQIVYDFDRKKIEEREKYEQQKLDNQKRDDEFNGPEWILDEKVETDE